MASDGMNNPVDQSTVAEWAARYGLPPLEFQEALFQRAAKLQRLLCVSPCPRSPRLLRQIIPNRNLLDENLQAVCPDCARRLGNVLPGEWEIAGLKDPSAA